MTRKSLEIIEFKKYQIWTHFAIEFVMRTCWFVYNDVQDCHTNLCTIQSRHSSLHRSLRCQSIFTHEFKSKSQHSTIIASSRKTFLLHHFKHMIASSCTRSSLNTSIYWLDLLHCNFLKLLSNTRKRVISWNSLRTLLYLFSQFERRSLYNSTTLMKNALSQVNYSSHHSTLHCNDFVYHCHLRDRLF